MKLSELIQLLQIHNASHDEFEVKGIQIHSGKVCAGDLFIAINGEQHDGHDYIDAAIEAGAVAIIGEKSIPKQLNVPYFSVENSRMALAYLSAHFYQYPAKKHRIIGITGTNGKTTTAYMVRHILVENGYSCGIIGTVSTIINGEEFKSINTTPDALTLQRWLAQSHDDFIVMEVSSHGLHQQRVLGIEFEATIFTNLSHEHLDYHHNLEDYFWTKARLFDQLKAHGFAIVNNDDYWGRILKDKLVSENKNVLSYGNDALEAYNEATGQFTLKSDNNKWDIQLNLPGLYNIHNAVAAFFTLKHIGLDERYIVDALHKFKGVPGRFELVSNNLSPKVLIDYAHTPDGVFNVLKTVRSICNGRIIHIFGFRGGRDRTKRKDMLMISTNHSDMIIFTTDDLNKENKSEMFEKTEMTLTEIGYDNFKIIEDRTDAIRYALDEASYDDWVVITGKGPEPYTHQFSLQTKSDRDSINRLLHQHL